MVQSVSGDVMLVKTAFFQQAPRGAAAGSKTATPVRRVNSIAFEAALRVGQSIEQNTVLESQPDPPTTVPAHSAASPTDLVLSKY